MLKGSTEPIQDKLPLSFKSGYLKLVRNDSKEDLLEKLERRVLDAGYSFYLRVETASMAPLLYPGDEIEIKKVPETGLKKGDIILFKKYPLKIAHRIIQIKNKQETQIFVTKADAGYTLDDPITKEDIIGVIVGFRRKGRQCSFDQLSLKTYNFFYYRYRLFFYHLRNFILITSRYLLFRTIYFLLYGIIAFLLRVFSRLIFSRDRFITKITKDIKLFVPAVSDIDVLVITHASREKEMEYYQLLGNFCKYIYMLCPVFNLVGILKDQEYCQWGKWGGIKAWEFFSIYRPRKDACCNKLSELVSKYSVFEQSLFLMIHFFQTMYKGEISRRLSADDLEFKYSFKALIKFLGYQNVLPKEWDGISHPEIDISLEAKTLLESQLRLSSPLNHLCMSVLAVLERDKINREKIHCCIQDLLAFAVLLMGHNACRLLKEFERAFLGLRSLREKISYSNEFLNKEVGFLRRTTRKDVILESKLHWPQEIFCYVIDDNLPTKDIVSILAKYAGKKKTSVSLVLKETTFWCVLLSFSYRSSWVNEVSSISEKRIIREMLKYHFFELIFCFHLKRHFNENFLKQWLIPNLMMVYLGLKHSVLVQKKNEIGRLFFEHCVMEEETRNTPHVFVSKLIAEISRFLSEEEDGF